jgi:hypothetical protein
MRLLVLAFALAACAGHGSGSIDEVVGAGCHQDTDCAHRCYTGPGYPGGFCSQSCSTDADCPDGTVCAAQSGGVCLFTCPPMECARLGGGWQCNQHDLAGGGKENVCAGG